MADVFLSHGNRISLKSSSINVTPVEQKINLTKAWIDVLQVNIETLDLSSLANFKGNFFCRKLMQKLKKILVVKCLWVVELDLKLAEAFSGVKNCG